MSGKMHEFDETQEREMCHRMEKLVLAMAGCSFIRRTYGTALRQIASVTVGLQ